MLILCSIVAPSTTLMSSFDSKITGSGSIRSQVVRDQLVWDKAILLQQLAHEFQRGVLVPPALDQGGNMMPGMSFAQLSLCRLPPYLGGASLGVRSASRVQPKVPFPMSRPSHQGPRFHSRCPDP